jgi:hypothetical protein
MAITTNKGTAVAIEHIPEGGKGNILQVGADLWNALVPTSLREGRIAVSVGLLQSHTETGNRGASLSPSVACWAVQSEDIQVSDRP